MAGCYREFTIGLQGQQHTIFRPINEYKFGVKTVEVLSYDLMALYKYAYYYYIVIDFRHLCQLTL